MANENKIILATIHQPSSEIFGMLDTLLLLAEGNCVYFGAAGDAVSYFERIGYKIPDYTNPADFLVNTVQENSTFFIEKWKEYMENNKSNKYINGNDIENYETKLKPKTTNRYVGMIFLLLTLYFYVYIYKYIEHHFVLKCIIY